jgi:tetratricopeptide (TPR) repeat protein
MTVRPVTVILFAALAASGLLAVPAGAQAQTPQTEDAPAVPDVSGGQPLQPGVDVRIVDQDERARPDQVDETALRYYARNRDYERVEQEIRRLRALHPDWSPPDDLFDPTADQTSDEAELWALFEQGDLEALDRAIEARQADSPTWQPSDELQTQIRLAKARRAMRAAFDSESWQQVIATGEANPGIVSCAEINNAWMLGEARARTGARDAAFSLFRTLIQRCDDFDLRLATLQKAAGLLSAGQVDQLFAAEAQRDKTDAQRAQIETVRADIARGTLMRRLGSGGGGVSAAEMERFADQARAARDPEMGAVLGWRFMRADNYAAAITWFERALGWGFNTSAAEGLIFAHLNAGNTAEARAIAERYRGRSGRLEAAWRSVLASMLAAGEGELGLDGAALEAYAASVRQGRDPDGAIGLGWQFHRAGDFGRALAWFTEAEAFGGGEEALEGRILSLIELGRQDEAQNLIASNAGMGARIRNLQAALGSSVGRQAALAYQNKDYATCLALTSEAMQTGGYDRGAASQRGWCLLASERPTEARLAFREALSLPARPVSEASRQSADAYVGIGWTLIRQGMAHEVLDLVETVSLPRAESLALRAESLTQMALQAYQAEDYAQTLRLLDARHRLVPPRRDVLEIQAWALFNSGRKSEARTLFKTLDRQFSTAGTKEGLRLTTPGASY